MKIKKIILHNFRSVKEQTFNLGDYSLLVGANNSGKTNIIDVLRVFYEKERFDREDFPKFATDDQESWIEIEFHLTDDEFANLRDDYKQPSNTLRVRKYFKSLEPNRVKSNQSNIYGYEEGNLANALFYGAKNISEAKLGDVVYIPEVAKVDEYTKLSGPSAFRDSLDFVVKKVAKNSPSFESLGKSFIDFNEKFKTEVSKDGTSIQNFINDVNKEIKDWDISFGVEINQIKPEEIIKHLVNHYLEDKNLKGQKLDISSFGEGFQRHLIYTLIKLSTKYQDIPIKRERKEFAPNFTLILFEEPEAFLHPAQQEILNSSLRKLSSEDAQQVLISTHSPLFVSKNIEDVPSILKLRKDKAETIIHQVDKSSLEEILRENTELKAILGKELNDKDLEEESIRYSLWLDSERCSAFFADTVLICEGATEKTLIDYLIKNNEIDLENKQVYILDAMGKYNIHRYMNLFNKLGIKHSILSDRDGDNSNNQNVNRFIKEHRNDFTLNMRSFDKDLETFLEVEPVSRNEKYKKPLNVMWHYKNGKIKQEKSDELAKIVKDLIG
jgi:predicted ATP-dependent endonuclease of OLD family